MNKRITKLPFTDPRRRRYTRGIFSRFSATAEAELYRYTSQKAPIYIIDPADIPVHDSRIIHIREKATTGMAAFLEML